MTYIVEDLIKELQKFDPCKEIYIAWEDEDGNDINKIEETDAAVFLICNDYF